MVIAWTVVKCMSKIVASTTDLCRINVEIVSSRCRGALLPPTWSFPPSAPAPQGQLAQVGIHDGADVLQPVGERRDPPRLVVLQEGGEPLQLLRLRAPGAVHAEAVPVRDDGVPRSAIP